MALQGSTTDSRGITSASSYAKVVALRIDYNSKKALAQVNIYHDSTASANDKEPVEVRNYMWTSVAGDLDTFDNVFGIAALDAVSKNPVQQAYDDIKTLAEFSGWTDV